MRLDGLTLKTNFMPPNQQNQGINPPKPDGQPITPAAQPNGVLSGGGMRVIQPTSSGVPESTSPSTPPAPQAPNASAGGQQSVTAVATTPTGPQVQSSPAPSVIYSHSSQNLLKSSKRQKVRLVIGIVIGAL